MVERHIAQVDTDGTPRVDSQITFPILTIDWRWIVANPGGTRHQPLFGMFADRVDSRSFQRFGGSRDCSAPNLLFVFDDFFRIQSAFIWEVTHQFAMLTWLFRLSV